MNEISLSTLWYESGVLAFNVHIFTNDYNCLNKRKMNILVACRHSTQILLTTSLFIDRSFLA